MRKLNLTDWLLMFVVIFSAFTELRVWKVGPSEILMLIWVILLFLKYKLNFKENVFIRFWYLYLVFLMVGIFNKLIIVGYIDFPLESSITYITFFVFTIGLSIYFYNTQKKVIAKVGFISYLICFIIYLILFIYGFFSENFLGYSLFYGDFRFSPLSNNPHQFVYLSGILILLGLFCTHYLFKNKSTVFVIYITALLYTLIIFNAESMTFFAALGVSLIVSLIHFLRIKLKINSYLMLSASSFVLAFMVLNIDIIQSLIKAFFLADSNGMVRINLWIDGLQIFIWETYFLGFGPGAHIPNHITGTMEAHQTFIDIALQAGLLGLLIYIFLIIKLVKFSKKYMFLLATVLFIITYSLSGFTLRRVSFWFACFVVMKFGEEKN